MCVRRNQKLISSSLSQSVHAMLFVCVLLAFIDVAPQKGEKKKKKKKTSNTDTLQEQKKSKKEMEFELKLAKEKEEMYEREKQLKINRLVQEVGEPLEWVEPPGCCEKLRW